MTEELSKHVLFVVFLIILICLLLCRPLKESIVFVHGGMGMGNGNSEIGMKWEKIFAKIQAVLIMKCGLMLVSMEDS